MMIMMAKRKVILLGRNNHVECYATGSAQEASAAAYSTSRETKKNMPAAQHW